MSNLKLRFQRFESMTKSWDDLFAEVAEFASAIPPDRLVSVSHSADNSVGVVCVWYWEIVNESESFST